MRRLAFFSPRSFSKGLLVGVLSMGILAGVAAQTPGGASDSVCGSLRNHYGPYDYRKDKDKLGVVEQYHFAPEVEMLIRAQSSRYPSGDISYTLHAFPNHHRALIAMVKWGERHKSGHPPGTSRSIDCWFDRAVRFAPNDTIVRVLFAGHLGRTQRLEQAKEQLARAAEFAGDNGFSVFNIGISYFELGDYPSALKYAHIAQKLGFTRPELQKLLEERNEWKVMPSEAEKNDSAIESKMSSPEKGAPQTAVPNVDKR